jgi:hypothetical protein
VDDLDAALAGCEILIAPNSPSEGARSRLFWIGLSDQKSAL